MSLIPLIFVWLDKRVGTIPGSNEKLREKFRKLLSPIRQFDKPTLCYDFLQDSTKDKRIIFFTSSVFADDEFLRKVSSFPNVVFLYIYDQQLKDYKMNDKNLEEKMGPQRIIDFDERLYEQIITDLIVLHKHEGEQFERKKEIKQAKPFYEFSLRLIETIDEQDDDLQKIQKDLNDKINQIK